MTCKEALRPASPGALPARAAGRRRTSGQQRMSTAMWQCGGREVRHGLPSSEGRAVIAQLTRGNLGNLTGVAVQLQGQPAAAPRMVQLSPTSASH